MQKEDSGLELDVGECQQGLYHLQRGGKSPSEQLRELKLWLQNPMITSRARDYLERQISSLEKRGYG